MEFLKVLFWEYMQNLPIIAGFCWALGFWQTGWTWAAILCILAGATGGAVLIALTEARKQSGYKEPKAVMLMNLSGMTLIMFIIVLYFSARWSNWLTDLLLGAVCGAGLAIAQSLAARKRINKVHSLALGIASPLILLAFRGLLGLGWPVWINALSVCLLATLVISLIDYSPWEPSAGELP
jgi:hypothetical protein